MTKQNVEGVSTLLHSLGGGSLFIGASFTLIFSDLLGLFLGAYLAVLFVGIATNLKTKYEMKTWVDHLFK